MVRVFVDQLALYDESIRKAESQSEHKSEDEESAKNVSVTLSLFVYAFAVEFCLSSTGIVLHVYLLLLPLLCSHNLFPRGYHNNLHRARVWNLIFCAHTQRWF